MKIPLFSHIDELSTFDWYHNFDIYRLFHTIVDVGLSMLCILTYILHQSWTEHVQCCEGIKVQFRYQ